MLQQQSVPLCHEALHVYRGKIIGIFACSAENDDGMAPVSLQSKRQSLTHCSTMLGYYLSSKKNNEWFYGRGAEYRYLPIVVTTVVNEIQVVLNERQFSHVQTLKNMEIVIVQYRVWMDAQITSFRSMRLILRLLLLSCLRSVLHTKYTHTFNSRYQNRP